jgi:hypothetical protein
MVLIDANERCVPFIDPTPTTMLLENISYLTWKTGELDIGADNNYAHRGLQLRRGKPARAELVALVDDGPVERT